MLDSSCGPPPCSCLLPMRWGAGAYATERLKAACLQCQADNSVRFKTFDWTGYRKEEAAVLLPLLPNCKILFTERSRQLRRHAGEVSFPGGMINRGSNEKPEEAALREFQEEV